MHIDEQCLAVVTGGASGLGKGTAQALLARGARVLVLDRDADAGTAVAATGAGYYACDVSDAQQIETVCERILAEHGVPQVLINCAGVAPAARTVGRAGPHDAGLFQQTIAINLIGTFLMTSRIAALMSQVAMAATDTAEENKEWGVIVNTASVAAFDGQVGQAAYAASKAGVAGMTLPLARDLASSGIRVCTIAPGIFKTPMLSAMPDELQASLAQQVPFPKRLGLPEDFASLALHIIENSMLNGEVIRLDGAIRMGPK